MLTRSLGPFTVTAIGLGCMNLSHAYGVPPSAEQGEKLLRTALDQGVTLFDTAALYGFGRNEELVGRVLKPHRREITLCSKGGMAGVQTEDGMTEVRTRRGVVLAAGGFPQDVLRRKELFAHAPSGQEHWSPAPPGNTGDGIRLGEKVGGRAIAGLPNAAAWVPVSLVPRRDGTSGPFPHFIDRGKPGVIAVTKSGKRFTNEANSYHDFVQAMVGACGDDPEKAAWLIVDHPTIRRYGLGFVKPFPAIMIGIAAGIVCYFMVTRVKKMFGYDDALDAFGVHGAGGSLGAILTGVFATNAVNDGLKDAAGKPLPLGLADGNGGQILNQLGGCAIAIGLAVVGTLIILKIVDAVIGVRVTKEQESDGLDLSQHNEEGYVLEN